MRTNSVTCLEELLEPVDNPRYLLITVRARWALLGSRSLLAAGAAYEVPSLLGIRNGRKYSRGIGGPLSGLVVLVYTRTAAGRRRTSEGTCPKLVSCPWPSHRAHQSLAVTG